MQKALQKELRFAAVSTLVLDILVWLVLLPFYGIGLEVPLGLLCGSAGMLLNLWLLRRSIEKAVQLGKTQDIAGYLLRCIVSCTVMALGMMVDGISAFAAVLPFLYPKAIFGVSVWLEQRKSRKQKS